METQELKLIEKRLGKYVSEQLLKKIETDIFSSPEEKQIAIEILIKRGKWNVEQTPTPEIEPIIIEQLSDENPPIVHQKVEKEEIVAENIQANKSISEIIDFIYATNDKELISKLCNLFPDEFETYNELTDDIKSEINELYESVVNPTSSVSKNKAKPENKNIPKTPVVKSKEKPKTIIKKDEEVGGNITIESSKEGVTSGQEVTFDHKGETLQGLVTRVLIEHRSNKEVCRVKLKDGKILIKLTSAMKIKK